MDNVGILLIITATIGVLTIFTIIAGLIIKKDKYEDINALKELEYSGLDLFAYDTELHLCSKRAQKVLMDLGVDTPSKLKTLTTDKLLATKGCGPSTVKEIKVLANGFDIFIV